MASGTPGSPRDSTIPCAFDLVYRVFWVVTQSLLGALMVTYVLLVLLIIFMILNLNRLKSARERKASCLPVTKRTCQHHRHGESAASSLRSAGATSCDSPNQRSRTALDTVPSGRLLPTEAGSPDTVLLGYCSQSFTKAGKTDECNSTQWQESSTLALHNEELPEASLNKAEAPPAASILHDPADITNDSFYQWSMHINTNCFNNNYLYSESHTLSTFMSQHGYEDSKTAPA